DAGGGALHAHRLLAKGWSRPVFAAQPGPLRRTKTLRRNPDMFSMAVAGLVKSLISVTITLNPAAAHHGPGSYTIRPGDTLSQIAARAYGSAARPPAPWWGHPRPGPQTEPSTPRPPLC